MRILQLVGSLLCLVALAFGGDILLANCTQEEQAYSINFIDNNCAKLSSVKDGCYSGYDVQGAVNECESGCLAGLDKTLAYDRECCFVKYIIRMGKTLDEKKATDAKCLPVSGPKGNDACVNGIPETSGRYLGQKTICAGDYCLEPMYQIFYEKLGNGSKGAPKAVAFLNRLKGSAPTVRAGAKIDSCETTSGMDGVPMPDWTKSGNKTKIMEKLKTHCFASNVFVQDKEFPFYIVFKVELEVVSQTCSFIKRKMTCEPTEYKQTRHNLAYVLPNKANYLILNNSDELNAFCTCDGNPDKCDQEGGGFGQGGTVNPNDVPNF